MLESEQLKSDVTNVFNQHDLSHNLSMNDVDESIRLVDKNPDSSNKIPESQRLKRKYKSKSKRKGLNFDKNLSENANSSTRSEVFQTNCWAYCGIAKHHGSLVTEQNFAKHGDRIFQARADSLIQIYGKYKSLFNSI